MGDLVALGVELLRQPFGPADRRLDRQQAHFADVLAVDLDRQRLGLETEAVTGLARRRAHVALDLFARPLALRLLVAPVEVGDDALERLSHLVRAQAVVVGEADLLGPRAVEDGVARRLGQLAPGPVEPELIVLAERVERLKVIGRARLRPGGDRAALQRQLRVRDDERRIDAQLRAEPAADRAGAVRVVEGEQSGLDLGDGEAGDRTGELRGEENALRLVLAFRLVGELDHRQSVRQLQRRLEALGEPRRHVGAHDNAVDHDFDVVLELLVERRRIGDLIKLAVDLEALEAALHPLGDLLAVFALAAAHDRGQQIEPRALRQGEHAIDHLAHRLALDRQAGRRRIGDADARPEKAHVIVDLGHGADGRARVLRGRLLLDGDGGRQAVDLVDVRLLHHLEELAGVGRKRLDIAPLAFGVDRVEGERRLARAGEAGEHDQLVARDGQIDVLQVVLARAAHDDRPAAEQGLDRRAVARGRCRKTALVVGAGHGSSTETFPSCEGIALARLPGRC